MRRFGNRVYSLHDLYSSKELAHKKAIQLRKEGKLARVVRGSCFAFTGDYYVYKALKGS